MCNCGVTRFLGWGKFGMITAPFANITIGQVEESKGASAWLQFGATKRN
jgi:hypothetical protein